MCVCNCLSVSILNFVSSYLLLVSSLYYNEDVLIKMFFYTHELDLVHTLWGQAFQLRAHNKHLSHIIICAIAHT